MAAEPGLVLGSLTRAAVERRVADQQAAAGALHQCLLAGPFGEEETVYKAVSALVKCRENGFMVVLPASAELVDHLDTLVDDQGEPVIVVKETQVQMETMRGRKLGETTVFLVDFPWDALNLFRASIPNRGAQATEVLRFMVGGTMARPNAASTSEACEVWIAEVADEEEHHFQEYLTAAEDLDGVPAATMTPPGETVQDHQDVIRQLQARIVELETKAVPLPPAAETGAYRAERELFLGGGAGTLDQQTWDKLRALAGPAPKAGRHEKSVSVARATPARRAASTALVEAEAEVGDPDELEQLSSTLTDPFHRLMALQLKQNNQLMSKLLPKTCGDAITSALGVGGNEPGSSSSGIRGCTAREVYLKQLDDAVMVSKAVLMNAQKDLGVAAPYPGLMRDYVEKKIPLGDMRLLTFFGTMLAHMWEVAYVNADELMLGHVSRALLFVEQSAMDGGKTQMGWLLAGWPEPNWAITTQNKKRMGVTPFGRLANPSWIAANVAFLKDLDFLENRLRTTGQKSVKEDESADPDKPPKTKRPWPKAKAKDGKERAASEAA